MSIPLKCAVLLLLGVLGSSVLVGITAYLAITYGLTTESINSFSTLALFLITGALVYATFQAVSVARDQMNLLMRQEEQRGLDEWRSFLEESIEAVNAVSTYLRNALRWMEVVKGTEMGPKHPDPSPGMGRISSIVARSYRWHTEPLYKKFVEVTDASAQLQESVARSVYATGELYGAEAEMRSTLDKARAYVEDAKAALQAQSWTHS